MKDSVKFTLIVAGIIAVFFMMGREILETKSKLKKTQEEVAREKKEKTWIQDELKVMQSRLVKTSKDLNVSQGKLNFVNRKIFILRGNNSKLITERKNLEYRIALLEEERSVLEAKFRSLKELKQAIREVKQDMRQEKIKLRQEYVRREKEIEKWETAVGNRGFLTKDGLDYCRPKVNVEVRPANISLNKNN